MPDLKPGLERLYLRYNDRRFVQPDPIVALYRFADVRDRELVALLAAGLAYGNVKAIVASVERLLALLGPSPRTYLESTSDTHLRVRLAGFRHRWTTGAEVANLLVAARTLSRSAGTLGAALQVEISPDDVDIQPALMRWHRRLCSAGLAVDNSLLADPAKSSASKRLHLALRWMVRCDAIDPGGWEGIPARLLLVPVDVHMHRIARLLRFTRRRQADLPTVREITRGFRRIAPDDPVRYDFALTRLPLHDGLRGTDIGRRLRAAFADDSQGLADGIGS